MHRRRIAKTDSAEKPVPSIESELPNPAIQIYGVEQNSTEVPKRAAGAVFADNRPDNSTRHIYCTVPGAGILTLCTASRAQPDVNNNMMYNDTAAAARTNSAPEAAARAEGCCGTKGTGDEIRSGHCASCRERGVRRTGRSTPHLSAEPFLCPRHPPHHGSRLRRSTTRPPRNRSTAAQRQSGTTTTHVIGSGKPVKRLIAIRGHRRRRRRVPSEIASEFRALLFPGRVVCARAPSR